MNDIDDIIDEIELGGNTNGVWIMKNSNNSEPNITQQTSSGTNNITKSSIITDIENETQYIKIDDLCRFMPESTRAKPGSEELKTGKFKFYTGLIKFRCNEADYSGESIIVSTRFPKLFFASGEFSCTKDTIVLQRKSDKINLKYLYCYLNKNKDLLKNEYKSIDVTKKLSPKNLDKEFLKNLEIPVLSEAKQKKIVAEYDLLVKLESESRKQIINQIKKLDDAIKMAHDLS